MTAIPSAYPDAEQLWRAFCRRDERLDDRIWVGVTSTGIFCRPSCPSRKPARANVRFFVRPEDARRAGFRACRRCRPDQPAGANGVLANVRRVCRLIEDESEEPQTLESLARRVGWTPFHLQRTFKRHVGLSPREYRDALRHGRFRRELQRRKVTDAVYEAGYGSSSRVYEHAVRRMGMTPLSLKRGGAGEVVRIALVKSPLGTLLVAATERGICRVALGESAREAESVLRAELPEAEFVRDGKALASWTRSILAHLEGRLPHLALPLDIRATAFQWRVWMELTKIPRGETRSYEEVARAVGKPRAARAVGRACATNPVSLIVPCHRVIAKDGSLGGYGWGLERKRELLEREGALEKSRPETRARSGRKPRDRERRSKRR